MKKVAIQGISGCYHEMAARRFFRDEDIEIDPCQTFDELFTHMNGNKFSPNSVDAMFGFSSFISVY